MKEKSLDIFRIITYYPRKFVDSIIFDFYLKRKNQWEVLDEFLGKDFLIVGNGPSLNKTPMDDLNPNLVSIGMNKINLIYDKVSWRPDIIVCINALVIRQNLEFFNSTKTPLVLPVKAYYIGVKPRKNILFIKLSSKEEITGNIRQSVSPGCTVTFAALQVAAHLKPKSVSIIGVDHSFISNKGKDHEIKKLEGDDPNHFSKDYFKNQFWGLPNLQGSERLYQISKEYYDSHNIPIIDYTVNGKLRVFERGDIQELMSLSNIQKDSTNHSMDA